MFVNHFGDEMRLEQNLKLMNEFRKVRLILFVPSVFGLLKNIYLFKKQNNIPVFSIGKS